MRPEWFLMRWLGRGPQLRLVHGLGLCIVLILALVPLWVDGAHRAEGLMSGLAPALERAGALGSAQPDQAPLTGHCAIHCAPLILVSPLLAVAVVAPVLAARLLLAAAAGRPRLRTPPPLPPPQSR